LCFFPYSDFFPKKVFAPMGSVLLSIDNANDLSLAPLEEISKYSSYHLNISSCPFEFTLYVLLFDFIIWFPEHALHLLFHTSRIGRYPFWILSVMPMLMYKVVDNFAVPYSGLRMTNSTIFRCKTKKIEQVEYCIFKCYVNR
jgi:hypothetical protein